jgi:hypothetical protein
LPEPEENRKRKNGQESRAGAIQDVEGRIAHEETEPEYSKEWPA